MVHKLHTSVQISCTHTNKQLYCEQQGACISGQGLIRSEIHRCCLVAGIDLLHYQASVETLLNKTPYACFFAAAKSAVAGQLKHMISMMHVMTHILERGAEHLLSRFPEVLQVTLGQVTEDIHQDDWKSCHHKG